MAAETKPSSGTAAAAAAVQFQVDEAYEYRAPKYFDFVVDETEDDIRAAERWFQAGASHAPSPFAPRIKESRAGVKIDGLCDFADADADAEEPAPSPKNEATEEAAGNVTNPAGDIDGTSACPDTMSESPPTEDKEEEESPKSFEFPLSEDLAAKSDGGSCTPKIQRPRPPAEVNTAATTRVKSTVKAETCTPKVQGSSSTRPKTVQPSNLKQSSLALKKKSVIKGARDGVAGKAATAANDIRQENQAVKRQKLDDGSTRQILNVKSRVLPHKGRGSLAGSTEVVLSSMRHRHDDAHSLKEVTVTPYISAAEMVKKFESGTRDLGSHYSRSMSNEDAATASQRRPKLMLTRPKEPEFQTTHRVRAVRVKSSSELEEEMLAKIPKFRARPFNKKMGNFPASLFLDS